MISGSGSVMYLEKKVSSTTINDTKYMTLYNTIYITRNQVLVDMYVRPPTTGDGWYPLYSAEMRTLSQARIAWMIYDRYYTKRMRDNILQYMPL
jgi:hypothetical protein